MTRGTPAPRSHERVISRRKLLGPLGVASAGLAVATTAGAALERDAAPADAAGNTVPFYGANQAGVSTPEQERPGTGWRVSGPSPSPISPSSAAMSWTPHAAVVTWSFRLVPTIRSWRSTPSGTLHVGAVASW